MTSLTYILVLMVIASFFIGYFVGYSPRSLRYKSWTSRHPPPFKRACKHGGGFCKDPDLFDDCPDDDPTQKVTCWRGGVFEDDPLQHDIQVDLGATGRSP